MVMGEDVGHYGGSYKARLRPPPSLLQALLSTRLQVTYDLYKKYGEFRLLDTPICEYSFMVRPSSASTRASLTRSRRAWVWVRQ